MGITFWLLFIVQIVFSIGMYKFIFKVEKETPTESITPATDQDVEVY